MENQPLNNISNRGSVNESVQVSSSSTAQKSLASDQYKTEEIVNALIDFKLKDFDSKLAQRDKIIADLVKKTVRDVDDLKQKINDSSLKFFESLAIFVALFTFVSITFKAFDQTDLLSSISVILISGAMLIGFCLVMDILIMGWLKIDVKQKKDVQNRTNILSIASLVLLIFGLGIVGYNDYSKKRDSSNLDEQKVNNVSVYLDPLPLIQKAISILKGDK